MSYCTDKTQRTYKGKSLMAFPDSFVCVDIETTGLSPQADSIIEISALRIENCEIISSFSECIKINRHLPPFITGLTGITDAMLLKADSLENVLSRFLRFIRKDIIVGHNVNFDINFLYDNCMKTLGVALNNDFVDTLRLSKRLLPSLQSHSLDALASYYCLTQRTLHRALGDCEMTVSCYMNMKNASLSEIF